MNKGVRLLVGLVLLISSLACNQKPSTVSKHRSFLPVSATIEGLNQYRNLPPIKITDREQLKTFVGFFDGIDEEPLKDGFYVDYNEKYKVAFSMPNGSKVIVKTLYNDGHWHREGEGDFDQQLRPGLSEFLEPFFQKESKKT